MLVFFCSNYMVIFAKESKEFEALYLKLTNEFRCPTCQGLSVKDSEAGFSNSIKNKIRELMKNKKSEEEIREFFVKRYGEWILRAPPKQGFNLVLWILPGTGILIGLMWIVFRSKRWKEDKNNEDLPQLTPEEEQKLKEDLWRFEKS